MNDKNGAAAIDAIGEVHVRNDHGLHAAVARRIHEIALRMGGTASLDNGRGAVADARDLLQLLLLGVRRGDRITVCCTGPNAAAAFEAITTQLAEDGGRP